MFADADMMVPPPSFVTIREMTAVPEPLASALVMAGTSLAGESGTVKVVVVLVPCGGGDGADGVSEHATARTLKPAMSTDIRYMWCCLPEFAQKNFRARLKPR